LAILRLSTALARLRLGDVVIDDDVNEAIRLVEKSRDSVKPPARVGGQTSTTTEQIKDIIRELKNSLKNGENTIQIKQIREKCAQKGFANDHIDRCLDEYENINIWQINQKRTQLTFV